MISSCSCAALLLLSACTHSNNLLLGRVEAKVGTHTVVVTDCYQTTVAPPEKLDDPSGQPSYRYAPCRDAIVLIRAGELTVNGHPYGHVNPNDAILVDHGAVSIDRAAK